MYILLPLGGGGQVPENFGFRGWGPGFGKDIKQVKTAERVFVVYVLIFILGKTITFGSEEFFSEYYHFL